MDPRQKSLQEMVDALPATEPEPTFWEVFLGALTGPSLLVWAVLAVIMIFFGLSGAINNSTQRKDVKPKSQFRLTVEMILLMGVLTVSGTFLVVGISMTPSSPSCGASRYEGCDAYYDEL